MNDPIPHCVVCDGTEYVATFPTRTDTGRPSEAGRGPVVRELGVCAFCDVEAPVGHCEECRRPIGSDMPFSILVLEQRFHRACLAQARAQTIRHLHEELATIPPCGGAGYDLEAQQLRETSDWLNLVEGELLAVGYRFGR